MTPDSADGPGTDTLPQNGAPDMEVAEQHSGSDHVSYGANSNLSPAAAPTEADAQAARVTEEQHQHKDS